MPGGNTGVMVTTDSILNVNGTVELAPQKSVAVTLNCAVMGDAEKVVRTLPFNAEPVGSVPGLSDHVMVPVPPVTCKAALYGVFTMPSGRGDVVVMAGSALQAIVNGPRVATLAVGVALSVTRRLTLVELAVH